MTEKKPRNYLSLLEDGLTMRESQDYARDKLYALQAYLHMARVAMKNKPWSAFNYIDLQAGPGKNRIGEKILFGSPLIALHIKPPFDHYWFNELIQENFFALQERISESDQAHKVHLFQSDVNEAVDDVVAAIQKMDQKSRSEDQWSSFNIAFLDPEGLEINWDTVEKLASVSRMDLIINFSTVGIFRNLHQPSIIDKYFGNQRWHELAKTSDSTQRRRDLINLYREQLKQFGYYISIDEEIGYHDISMKNRKNAEVYSLIFASKHPLGDDFWQKVKQQIDKLRRRSDRLL